MLLNLVYDSSVDNAPAGFTAALNAAVSFFQRTFQDPVTVNIAVGYGEVNGQPLGSGALGSSLTYFNNYTYAQIFAALAADSTSADDASSIASLPLSNPVSGNYWMTTAQAKAVGLQGASSHLDGYVGFTSSPILDFDNSNGVSPGQYDFFGVIMHEITEVMGRQLIVGANFGGGPSYDAMDMFHFSAPGVHSFVGAQSGYFSLDNGVTNLGNFNTNSHGDYGDWASSMGNDAMLAFSHAGVVNGVSAADLKLMDILGWDTVAGNVRPAAYDFNGDGKSDILWQNENGQAAVRVMDDSGAMTNVALGGNPGSSWHVIGAADFNGDGKPDILWQNVNGQPGFWTMDGTTQTGVAVGGNPGPSWHIIGTGDFNGDSKPDILWQNDSGQAGIWTMNGTTETSGAAVGSNPGPAWHIMGAGDFNGDGKADILWQNNDGSAGIWLMNGTSPGMCANVGANPGPAWHVKGVGDFNSDGKADILWQNNDGSAGIWLMNGLSPIMASNVGSNPGPSWHVEGAGDYNGDGKSDILWQNDDGQAAVWLMDGTTALVGATVGDNLGPSWHIDWA